MELASGFAPPMGRLSQCGALAAGFRTEITEASVPVSAQQRNTVFDRDILVVVGGLLNDEKGPARFGLEDAGLFFSSVSMTGLFRAALLSPFAAGVCRPRRFFHRLHRNQVRAGTRAHPCPTVMG
jgi:hypothetical protein